MSVGSDWTLAASAGSIWVMMPNSSGCSALIAVTRDPWSTRIEVAGTTRVKIASDAVTTSRRIQPQIARPVAVAAGLCFSTVSVKPAIHAT